MARRKTVPELLAEALLAKQQAKLAQSQPAQPAPARRRPRRPRTPDPLAEHARLLAAGEKLLAKQDAAKAKEAARIEADLAKRQGAREREAQQRRHEQERSEREQKRQQRDSTKQELKDEADRRNREIATEAAELEAVLRERPDGLEDWHPLLERAFAHDGANGVAEVVEDLLRRSPLPPGCRDGAVVGYAPESAQLLVDIGLPSQDVVPTVAGYRFVAQRAEIIPQLVKEADHQETYRRLLARLALRALDEAFSVTPPQMVDTILLNGHVATTDPATGQAVRPCVVSVVVERADFAELVLDEPRLDPQRCLRNLGAVVSQHPHDLEPVPPVVEFDPSRFKLAADTAVVGALDSRPDLLQMDPYAFERLVRELFTAMGYETWRTQNSRDDGLDAVAIQRDPLGVTVFAIQAKRTKNVVSPEVVRALLGTLKDKQATRGVLVTTSWYGKTSRDFAHRHQLDLIDGRNLKALLLDHLGIDALIGLPKIPLGWQQSDLT
ncbi:restriction system protein [Kitasatospora sp. MAA4]|uniref:restriction endonuclease n=1 Tax=Kitasatospora sp. MAA4 TaxID=3035093 RepID=UPI002475EB9B|nr:restriction endonuclease [Kitasatospora sp. MAA4]MDH6134834.1 restriction system protein [Kitasatospora sp. MAA4]